MYGSNVFMLRSYANSPAMLIVQHCLDVFCLCNLLVRINNKSFSYKATGVIVQKEVCGLIGGVSGDACTTESLPPIGWH